MNKVDKEVAALMTGYPDLYSNRLEALQHIFCSSSYSWNENGCLVRKDEAPSSSKEAMTLLQAEVEEAKRRREESEDEKEKLFLGKYVMETQIALNNYAMRVEDIEVAASHFVYETHAWKVIDHVLVDLTNDLFTGYCSVVNKPEVVDQEWSYAIRRWLSQLFSCMNSMWGKMDRKTYEWSARKEEKTFNKIMELYKQYETELDREADRISEEIIDELLAEG